MAFRLTRPVIARANGVLDPADVERAFARSEAALDSVARDRRHRPPACAPAG